MRLFPFRIPMCKCVDEAVIISISSEYCFLRIKTILQFVTRKRYPILWCRHKGTIAYQHSIYRYCIPSFFSLWYENELLFKVCVELWTLCMHSMTVNNKQNKNHFHPKKCVASMTLLKKKINNKIRNSCLNRIQAINVIEIIGYACRRCQNGAHIVPTVTHKQMYTHTHAWQTEYAQWLEATVERQYLFASGIENFWSRKNWAVRTLSRNWIYYRKKSRRQKIPMKIFRSVLRDGLMANTSKY